MALEWLSPLHSRNSNWPTSTGFSHWHSAIFALVRHTDQPTLQRDPDEWNTGDEPLTDAQRLGLQLVAAGLVVGLAISFATNRLLTAQLWKTSPNDPVTFALVILLIATIGVLACWIPARRAVRVQPMIALRHE